MELGLPVADTAFEDGKENIRRIPGAVPVRARMGRFVIVPAAVGDHVRSSPTEINETVPSRPIAPVCPKEHPPTIFGTADRPWHVSEPVSDPTLVR